LELRAVWPDDGLAESRVPTPVVRLVEWEEGWRDKANITRDAHLAHLAHLALDRGIIVNDTNTIVYLHNVDIWDQHSSTAARHLQERMTSRHDAWHKYTNTKYRKYWVLTGHLPARICKI
jgi:hypothetical protein